MVERLGERGKGEERRLRKGAERGREEKETKGVDEEEEEHHHLPLIVV